LGPVAISSNANTLAVAQFSILCMGMVFLEWRHLQRQQPLAAGVCWALAMIKPQIALFHGTPLLLGERHKKGLGAGLLCLALLSGLGFLYTGLSPLVYGQRFFRLLGKVQDDAGWNVGLQLSHWGAAVGFGLATALLASTMVWWRNPTVRQWARVARIRLVEPERWIAQAGLFSLLGWFTFYHRSTDHIMLAPALLAMADLSWRGRRCGMAGLTFLLGLSLWTPARIVQVSPILSLAQSGIWWLCTLVLATACLRAGEKTPVTRPDGPQNPLGAVLGSQA
jgi:hypothetical protein